MNGHRSRSARKPAANPTPGYEGRTLTPAVAQALQDDATERGTWLTWVVSAADLEHPGKFTARAHTAGHQGGVYLPGALVAATLGELRAQLPTGLTRHERTSAYPPDVVEDWD